MRSGQDEASGFGYRQTAASLVARCLPLLYLTLNVVDPGGQRHDRYELVQKLMQDARKLAEQRFQVCLAVLINLQINGSVGVRPLA